jgi:hypothetical protein
MLVKRTDQAEPPYSRLTIRLENCRKSASGGNYDYSAQYLEKFWNLSFWYQMLPVVQTK